MHNAMRWAAAAAVVWMAGCKRAELAPGVTDSTYVRTVSALRAVQLQTALDSAQRAAIRSRVLQEQGLTSASLEQAARALARDPERAGKVWGKIRDAPTAVTPAAVPGAAAKTPRPAPAP